MNYILSSFLTISLFLFLGESNDRLTCISPDDGNVNLNNSKEDYSENEQLVLKFHKAVANQDEEEIASIISDDIVFSLHRSYETRGKEAFLDYIEWAKIMKVKVKIDSIYTYKNRLLLVESEKSKWTKFFHKMTVHNRIRYFVKNAKIEKIEVWSAGYPISGGARIEKYHKWLRTQHPEKLHALQKMNAESAKINLDLMKEYSKHLKSKKQ